MGNMAVFARSLHLGRFAFAALFLFAFVSGAWGACSTNVGGCFKQNYYKNSGCTGQTSESVGCLYNSCWESPTQKVSCTGDYGTCTNAPNQTCNAVYYQSFKIQYCDVINCSTACEADSAACVNDGGTWANTGAGTCSGFSCTHCDEQCQCEEQGMLWTGTECIEDTTVCDQYRQQCATLGGEFTGTVMDGECSAVCNTCGTTASKKILEVKSRSCCSQSLAPAIDQMCTTPLQSGIGMTVSSNANLECQDPNLSEEAMQSYVENCSEPKSSSSGEPSSSGGGTSSESNDTTGVGYDYYPILDTIRDSLVDIRKNVETITTCLLTPGACAGLMNEGDTVIVNASDSVYIKQLGNKIDGLNSTLDTSIQNSNDRLQGSINVSIANANDTLIDSIKKYVKSVDVHGDIENMDSANRKWLSDIYSVLSQIERDSSGAGLIVGKLDSALGSGSGADTSGVSFGWLQHGELLGDSILDGSGYGGLDFAGDSLLRDSLANAGYSCNNDSCCIGSQCVYFDSDSLIEDSLTRYISRMGDSINQKNTSYLRDSTAGLFQEVQDSLKSFNPLGIFDSTMLNTLGAKIPNTNTCPEHCSKFQVNIPFFFGSQSYTIDFGLCLGRAVFANGNVLSFLRFIIRLIVAVTCITAVMWNAARIRR